MLRRGGPTGRLGVDEGRDPGGARPVGAVGGLALLASGLATGAVATLLAVPALLAGTVALAPRRSDPAHVAGFGFLCTLTAAILAPFGPPLGVALAAAGGLGSIVMAARLALARAPVPESLPTPPSAAPLHVAVGADLLLEAAWRGAGRVLSAPDWARAAAETRALVARFAERGWNAHPERAHPPPPPLEKPALRTRSLPGLGRFEELRFASEFEPGEPELRNAYLDVAPNREARAFLWRDASGERPTLVCVHGFGMGRVAWDAWRWRVDWLHRELGLDVALLVLPFHGPRAPGRLSGFGFFDRHPVWTHLALSQSLWDLRRLSGWLRAQGAPSLGVHGLSLGGGLAAVYASLEPGLDAAIAMTPAVSLADLWWRFLPPARRAAAAAAGLDLGLLRQAWAPHGPLHHRPRVAHAARLIIGGSADRVTPPESVRRLWEHWERPSLCWFPGAHLVWLGRRDLAQSLAAHLRATLLAERPSPPPLSRFRRGT